MIDVEVRSDIPELAKGLPTEAITLQMDPVELRPLSTEVEEGDEPAVVLRRGPASDDAETPVMFVITDDDSDEPVGARVIVMGISIGWLPDDVADALVRNISDWMFADK